MRKIIWFGIGIALIGLAVNWGIWTTSEWYTERGEVDGDPIVSPNHQHEAVIRYELYGGAAGGVRAIVNVGNRTIYVAEARERLHLVWETEDILRIENGDFQLALNVDKERYDESGRQCKKYIVKKYSICYEGQMKNQAL